ncbi:hypothetical protein [Polyangium sp. 15x6]|uniref:tetratricopeptide repeat protein n=1 Tax=Polyangium sp. 15x6 TaxID=3042687 RepID=UPI00249A6F0C|nr:hypothetical protein [Polyangium sp. 15x6]MDI3282918.1 hypothetical protein [Polyangium sp. 15x6]
MNRSRRVSLAGAALLAALFFPFGSRADEPPKTETETPPPPPEPSEEELREENRAVALEKGRRAMQLFRAGQYAEAYPLFRDADEAFHTPQLVLYMARCQDKRGKLLEARALYERTIVEPLPEAPSNSLLRARQAATAELGPVRLRIPTLAVDVRGPPPTEVTLFVDGELWPMGEPRELDPGKHEVEALARSGARTTREVELPEGRSVSIVLRLGLFAKGVERTIEPAPAPPTRPTWSIVAASGLFSISALTLVTGVVMGGLTLNRREVLEMECVQERCTQAGFDAYEQTKTYASVSNLGFGAAAIAAAAGVSVLLFTPSTKPAVAHGARVELDVRGGFMAVRGVF